MRDSLSCRGRAAYGTSLSEPPLPLAGASRDQWYLNKLKVSAG